MRSRAFAKRFVRIGSLAFLMSILISACELSTAPRFPEEEEEERPPTEDDG